MGYSRKKSNLYAWNLCNNNITFHICGPKEKELRKGKRTFWNVVVISNIRLFVRMTHIWLILKKYNILQKERNFHVLSTKCHIICKTPLVLWQSRTYFFEAPRVLSRSSDKAPRGDSMQAQARSAILKRNFEGVWWERYFSVMPSVKRLRYLALKSQYEWNAPILLFLQSALIFFSFLHLMKTLSFDANFLQVKLWKKKKLSQTTSALKIFLAKSVQNDASLFSLAL